MILRTQTQLLAAKECHMSPTPRTAPFSNQFGVTRVYTRRHINGCPLGSPNENSCSCPKWIYAKPKHRPWTQKAAGTPSYTEAAEKAQRLLRSWDPDIRRAQEQIAPAPGITVEAAVSQYLAVTSRRDCDPKYLQSLSLYFMRRPERPAGAGGSKPLNASLLDFLDDYNRTHEPIVALERMTSEVLDRWAETWRTNDLSSKLWRNCSQSFFLWALRRGLTKKQLTFSERIRVRAGNRCGYFTDDEYRRIVKSIPFFRIYRHPLPANYRPRMLAFVELGRWAGMAGCDIVRFTPDLIGRNNVLTYRRKKIRNHNQVAKVLLPAEVAARLRAIPPEPGSDRARPFFFPDQKEPACVDRWRFRFQQLAKFAGITKITTEHGKTRKPHPHMLRDTFAIDAITRGVDLTNVAKMLGHSSVEMTQSSYLFWIEKRIDHCIEDQRAALTRVLPVSSDGLLAAADRDGGLARRETRPDAKIN